MTRHDRDTFLTDGELLRRTTAHTAAIVEQLQQFRRAAQSPRVALLLDTFEAEEQSLHDALLSYADDAPREVLETFAQYARELPAPLPEPESPLTAEALAQWLLDQNEQLVELHARIANSTAALDIGEAFGNLEALVRSRNMRIAKEANRMRDL